MKRLRDNKVLKGIGIVIKSVLFIFFALFILVVCLQRFTGNKVSFFNYRMFNVISGSMRPVYDIGDVLIAKETDPSLIKEGDVISYLGEKGDFNGKVITHKVMGINKDVNGGYVFRTKGTANLVEDPTVYERQLYGVVIYKSVVLSFIYRMVATKYGMLIFIIVPIFYIIGSEIVSSLLAKEEKRREKLQK